MCGIAGIYAADGRPIDKARLKRMGDAIAHRGPDGEGFFVNRGRPSVGLVNRRLAVIDVDGGTQPITIEDGAFTIVYNGELFNTASLRRDLESRGHRFRTRCDTEVVARAYAQWGAAALERLDGMWAFAIWDRDRHSVFLARDRLGIKPLVYAASSGAVIFGSEIKALMASGLIEPELDPTALPHYLSAYAVPEPLSLFQRVRRLQAGHAMMLSPDGPHEFQYWDCAMPEEPDRGRTAYKEEIAALLEDSTRRTLVSDVPLGVLLSGGVDSRLLATYASRHTSHLETFTLGFDDPAFDERPSARAVAVALGSQHHEDTVSVKEGSAYLRSLVESYDEPGQSLMQTHLISRFARRSVTVALSGVGGDELFAAYPTHVATNVLARLDSVPSIARTAIARTATLAPARRLKRLAYLSSLPPDQRVTDELFHQTTSSLRSDLLSDSVRSEVDLAGPATYLADHLSRAQSEHPLNRLLYLYLKTYLPNELLRAADAMSMLNSLELRVPFLDHHLVERAMVIPAAHKMRFRKGKLVLHDIANSTLTDPTSGIKRGFAPPLGVWMGGELGEQIADTLTQSAIQARGIFDPDTAGTLVRRCLAGDQALVPAVMMLYSFEVWAQHWLRAPAQAVDGIAGATRCPELSVIIASWNTLELTRSALLSVRQHLASVNHEVIVVDNNSNDGSPEMLATEFPEVRLIRNAQNVGFGRANNQAMAEARGEWLLLLNSDAELLDDSVARLHRRIAHDPTIGVAHCRLVSADGNVQHTTYRFPSVQVAVLDNLGFSRVVSSRIRENLLGGYWDQTYERDVDSVAGAFMLVKREVYDATGGFDESIFMYGEDIEWCYRIRDMGWRVRYFPDVTVLHHDRASSSQTFGDKKRILASLFVQRTLVARRHGPSRATLYTLLLLIGTLVRLAYYTARSLGSHPTKERFRAMIPFHRLLFRSLFALLWGRQP